MKPQRSNKQFLVMGIIVVAIFALRLLSVVLPERTRKVNVFLPPNEAQGIPERRRQQQAQAFTAVSDGEVSRTAERIRDATALATAVSLYAAKESLAMRTPANVGALLTGTNAAGLLPPGMQLIDDRGGVGTGRSQLFVRYRIEPLGIEVVCLGKERRDGPALLVRVPDDGMSADGARLYMATRLDEITVPAPFAHEAEVIVSGFSPEPLRARKL